MRKTNFFPYKLDSHSSNITYFMVLGIHNQHAFILWNKI